jgi:hypothetical protein
MERELASAVSLARALMALARSVQTGWLAVWGQQGRADVSIVAGIPQRVTALPGADEPLGDTLLRAGQFNWPAHQQAMKCVEPPRPIGRWLVETGVTTPSAVCSALDQQLRERLLHLFSLRALDYHWHASEAITAREIAPQISMPALVLSGVKRALTDGATNRVRRSIDGKPLRLTSLGRFFVKDDALLAGDAALLQALSSSTDGVTIEMSAPHASDTSQTVTALFLLSCVTVDFQRTALHSLLVRKRRQIRDRACPGALLDLPPGSPPAQARRALRRLTAQIHPDRLGPNTPEAVQHASSELLKALVRAENELRSACRP